VLVAAGVYAPGHHGELTQRRVSSRGVTQVVGQPVRVGYAHRHTLVDIDVHATEFYVYDHAGDRLIIVPRTSGKEVTRTRATVSAAGSARNRHPSPDAASTPMS
jgi:hypothetical protein